MELYIEREALSRGLSRIQGIIERRGTLPVLANVLLHAREGGLRLTGTDTEVAFLEELDANVESAGELAVDAAGLFQVVRTLPDATVHLKVAAGNRLEIVSGRASFRLLGIAAEEYPALAPFSSQGTAKMAEADLKRLVDQVSFSVAKEEIRYGLNGAHVEDASTDDEKKIRWVATDGHRLALAEAPFEGEFAFTQRMLVPKKALEVLKKLLDRAGQDTIELDFGDGAMQLRRGGQTFWFRLLEGEFPDYTAVVPKEHKHRARVRRSELSDTLRRVSVLVADRARAVGFSFAGAELEVQVNNVDRGEVRESVPIELDGEDISVGFNARYLQDILAVMPGDFVELSLAHPLAPCLVRNPEIASSTFVVMPMRLD